MHRPTAHPPPPAPGFAGQPVIAWVLGRSHFVLVVGWDAADADTLYVHDPYFLRESYSYATDIDGWRLYEMEPCSDTCEQSIAR